MSDGISVRINSRLIIFRIIIRLRSRALDDRRKCLQQFKLSFGLRVFLPVASELEEASRRDATVWSFGWRSAQPRALRRSFIFKTYSRQTPRLPDERGRKRHVRRWRIARDTDAENISAAGVNLGSSSPWGMLILLFFSISHAYQLYRHEIYRPYIHIFNVFIFLKKFDFEILHVPNQCLISLSFFSFLLHILAVINILFVLLCFYYR